MLAQVGLKGSPPPTRGTELTQVKNRLQLRITPAYAGNRVESAPAAGLSGDHPRLRGEQRITAGPGVLHPGSPPPTRGTAALGTAGAEISRITPAYAGSREDGLYHVWLW